MDINIFNMKYKNNKVLIIIEIKPIQNNKCMCRYIK